MEYIETEIPRGVLFIKQMFTVSSFETLEYTFLEWIPDAKTSHLYSYEVIKWKRTACNEQT